MASTKESADTPNWQTIPHSIYYTRIPVESGDQSINLKLDGRMSEIKILNIDNIRKGEVVIYPFYSLAGGETGTK